MTDFIFCSFLLNTQALSGLCFLCSVCFNVLITVWFGHAFRGQLADS